MGNEHAATLVVGVDGSAESQQALDWAVHLARATRRMVRAVTVCIFVPPAPTLSIPAYYADPDTIALTHEQLLASAVRQAEAEKLHVDVRTSVLHGEPGRALCAVAEGASALVVGSHGYGAALRAVLGSVSSYCVRHAKCPVLVIPPGATGRAGDEVRTAKADRG